MPTAMDVAIGKASLAVAFQGAPKTCRCGTRHPEVRRTAGICIGVGHRRLLIKVRAQDGRVLITHDLVRSIRRMRVNPQHLVAW